MGRVHRIGQQHDCYIFNFCATNTIEGQLLERQCPPTIALHVTSVLMPVDHAGPETRDT
jgi:hypothetical protein